MEFMNRILTFFLSSFLNMSAVLIGVLVMTYYLPRRSHYWLRVTMSFLVIGIWMFIGKQLAPMGGTPRPMISILTFMGLFLFVWSSVMLWNIASWSQALFAVTVSYALQNACERLVEIPVLYWDWFPRQAKIILFGVSLFMLHRVITRYQKKQMVFDFSNVDNRILLFVSTGVMVGCVVLDMLLKISMSTATATVQAYICVLMALFSVLVVILSFCHVRETDSQRLAEETARLLQAEQRRYEYDKQIHDAINIKCHDIRHQIAAIRAQATDDVYQAELKKIGKLVDIYDTAPHSQNAALDVVLAGKMLTCNNMNINITCMADGRRMEFMEDCDIYALFGNILDNAIEAASQVTEPEQRLITLTVENRENFLVVECENYFSGQLVFDDGLPLTTKSDTLNHGFGTHSIRALTEKYGGSVKLSTEGDIFDLSILIPIPA